MWRLTFGMKRLLTDFDVILAGGGLSSGLIALRLRKARPDLRLAIIEQGSRLGGNHTWSFHGSDVPESGGDILQPMVRKHWPAQDVRFPLLQRTLDTAYQTIASEDFDRHVRSQVGAGVVCDQPIARVSAASVELAGGQILSAPCVIDGRGWRPAAGKALALAYQKFYGLEVELQAPHGLERPVIMDATVMQTDGYRFFYCLPFSPTQLLIEDTYYSTSMGLDDEQASADITDYARRRGWSIRQVLREERGCLPIVLAGQAGVFETDAEAAAPCGLRAGLLHPTTGYSLPDGVRLANALAGLTQFTTERVRRETAALGGRLWRERSFYRMLNRLLFIAARGDERRDVMQRFYRLPRPLIERFYAGQTTAMDKLRILSGKPPIAIGAATRALPAAAAWSFVARHGHAGSH